MCSKFHSSKKWSPIKIVGMVIGGIILAAGLAFLFGWVVMLLWNWLMPEIFDLGTIDYWQAVGIIILAKLIFGFGGGHGGSHDKKSSPKNRIKSEIKSEINKEVKENFKKWHHYEGFWKDKGKQAFEDYVQEKEAEDVAHEDLTNEENDKV